MSEIIINIPYIIRELNVTASDLEIKNFAELFIKEIESIKAITK